MTASARPGVLGTLETHRGIDRGVRQLVAAIRPTLGPLPRLVAVARPDRSMTPELLDNGAVIARRIIALPDVRDDAGAMYLRGFLWRLHEETGDGSATAAILFAAVMKGGRRAVAAGIPAQLLQPHLEQAGELVRAHLKAMATPSQARQDLIRIAQAVCHDAALAELLGDVFDVAGSDGEVVLVPSKRRESWREFVDGSYWDGGAHSPLLLHDPVRQRTDLANAALVISNLAIDDPLELVPALAAAQHAGADGLAVIARSLSADVIAMLAANSTADDPIVAVKSPGFGEDERRDALQDLAVLTGGRVFLAEAGDRLRSLQNADLGRARRVWTTPQQVGIVSGEGDARAIRRHIDNLICRRARATNPEERRLTARRLGKFHGVSATVWIGADADLAATGRIDAAQRAVLVVRQALRGGVVPGGGAALLACRQPLTARLGATRDPVERAALRVVADALEAPFRAMLTNCGFDAASILAAIAEKRAGFGFDVLNGRIVEMREAGIVDPVGVLTAATVGAIGSAALALTIDAIVLTRKTDVSVDPE